MAESFGVKALMKAEREASEKVKVAMNNRYFLNIYM